VLFEGAREVAQGVRITEDEILAALRYDLGPITEPAISGDPQDVGVWLLQMLRRITDTHRVETMRANLKRQIADLRDDEIGFAVTGTFHSFDLDLTLSKDLRERVAFSHMTPIGLAEFMKGSELDFV